MNAPYNLLPLALTAILTAAPAFGAGPRGMPSTQPTQGDLNPTEVAALLFLREEERLARDVYLVMDERWQLLPFEKIAQSEQKHMDAVKNAMDRAGLVDPSDPNVTGVFSDGTLQNLYTDLVNRGEQSYFEALQVGALIEEVDIADLENAVANTDNLDLQTLYGNLLRGSRNHLRALVAEIERQGGEAYAAQHLEQDVVDAILDSPMERGGQTAGGAKRLGMIDSAPSLNQTLLVARLDSPLARGGNGGGTGSGQGAGGRKGGGTGICQG